MNDFLIQALDPAIHRREEFDCGVEALNRYLSEQAGQDIRRRAAGCWVMVQPQEPGMILGYYTLSPDGVEAKDLPDTKDLHKILPRYPRLGAVLLGRLAVQRDHQGLRIGERLLFDAFRRSFQSEIPSVLMVADPKNENAEAFYAKYGFQRLSPERLFLTMLRISKILETQG